MSFEERKLCPESECDHVVYPGILWDAPFVDVPAATRPLASMAINPIVS